MHLILIHPRQHLGEKRNQSQLLKREITEQERLVTALVRWPRPLLSEFNALFTVVPLYQALTYIQGKEKTEREEQLVTRRQLIEQCTAVRLMPTE
jgi:hypothetical protein